MWANVETKICLANSRIEGRIKWLVSCDVGCSGRGDSVVLDAAELSDVVIIAILLTWWLRCGSRGVTFCVNI